VEVEGPYLKARRAHISELPAAIIERLGRSSHKLKFSTLRAEMQERYYLTAKEVGDAVVKLAADGIVEATWKARGGRRPNHDDLVYLLGGKAPGPTAS